MKKYLIICVMMVFVLAACGKEPVHNHTWVEANCTDAKKCSSCGAVEGVALGHTWAEATCTTAKTCSNCAGYSAMIVAYGIGFDCFD